MRSTRLIALVAAPWLALTGAALAGNGMIPSSFGPRSPGMAGVDLGVATDTGAMNTNPAGITHSGLRADLAFHGTYIPGPVLDDQVTQATGDVLPINQGKKGEPAFFPLFDAGVSLHVWNGLYAGLGFFVEGGMGADFKGVASFADPDPTAPNDPTTQIQPITYDAHSKLSYMKLTPTLAWRFELSKAFALSLGVAANLGFSKLEFSHTGFPMPEADGDFMNAAHAVTFSSDYAFVWGLRAGALVEVLDGLVSVGAAYALATSLPYSGTTTIDGANAYDAKVRDFSWPAELGVGVSSRPLPGLLVGVDYRHIFWSDAVDTITVTNAFSGQAQPGYPPAFDLPFALSWNDQDVIAAGAEYTLLGLVPLRAGYAYARSTVGPEGVNALFPAIAEHNVTVGAGLRGLVPGLALDVAFLYTPRTTVTSDASNPAGYLPEPGADGQPVPSGYKLSAGLDGMEFHVGVGYQF